MTQLTGIQKVEMIVHEAKNLDTICYRGEAPVAHIAMVSQADVYDQVTNPDGLQRDLSPKHASEAYEYVRRSRNADRPRAFPEVVLNVRDKRVIELEPIEGLPDGVAKQFRLSFDRNKMSGGKVSVSRVDGNHRLYYAEGDDRRDPLLQNIPFQVHIGLSRDQERQLFVDINANQKGLNSSHLAIMQTTLTPDELEIRDHLDRWIARRLTDDPASPWHGIVHLGGSKKGSRAQGLLRAVNFASLQSGIARTLSKSQYIHDLTDPQAQCIIVRNYWLAVKTIFSTEWGSPKKYLLLKNIGVLSMSILGGTIIDRCLARGKYETADLCTYLRQAYPRFDWSNDAAGDNAVTGMSGNRAALIIAGEMAAELSDDTGSSTIRGLQAMLLGETTSEAPVAD
jgi:DGQHR domain-containing protein